MKTTKTLGLAAAASITALSGAWASEINIAREMDANNYDPHKTTALAAAGFETVQVVGTTASGEVATTVGVGVAVPGGCVFGGVAPDAVTLEAGGPIADGGCLEMPAH